MNHSLGDLPGTLYLHSNKLSFMPNKNEIKKLNDNLLKIHQSQTNQYKNRDIVKQRKMLKKGLWQREVQWYDVLSFDIIYLPPNNIMDIQEIDDS